MEFGFFSTCFVPEPEMKASPSAEHEWIMKNIDLACEVEKYGIKYVWAPEHHFLYEYSHAPAPEVFLSFVAARTQKIHVGSAIFNITPPVNSPVRTAERVAVFDHLSEGRFEFGTGRGSSSTEYMGFGIPNGDVTKEMWDEAIVEIVRMWNSDVYEHEGRFFSTPPRRVVPKPNGPSHPPLWVACGNPGTFEKAGRMGLGALCFTSGNPEKIAPLIETYKKAVAEADPVGDYVNDNVLCVANFLCMDDHDAAMRYGANMKMSYHQALAFHWLDSMPKPKGFPVWPEKPNDPSPEQLESLVEAGIYCVGDPDDCSRVVQKYVDVGADQLVLSPLCNYMDYETARYSFELFGREVVPKFDTDPVHRTTRMRQAAMAPTA
jgi:alkanesulfonate monooxygenase SsuD/methylene tetrahydromethanopterin reductase-like flavin-dependent oxidoreductase (luciferase family)